MVQGSLEITLKKPAADAKVGVSLVGSPPLVHQIRAGGLGAAAGLRLRDRVVSVNGLPVSGQEDAAAALAAAPAGALVVVVERLQVANPPGTPPGGAMIEVAYCGVVTWIIGILLCPCVCGCPCDKMTVYRAPDGTLYNMLGAATNPACMKM